MPEVRERAGHQPAAVFRQTAVIVEHVPGPTSRDQEVSGGTSLALPRLPGAAGRYLDAKAVRGTRWQESMRL